MSVYYFGKFNNKEACWLNKSHCCNSVAKSCPILCDPMNCTRPGFLVLQYLLEFAQTYVPWVGDAIQPSHPLWHPSPHAFNLSHHQSFPVSQFFASGGQRNGTSVSVFLMNIQGWIPLGLTGLFSLLSKALSRSLIQHNNSKISILSCSTFMVQLLHSYMTLENHSFHYMKSSLAQWYLCFLLCCLGLL